MKREARVVGALRGRRGAAGVRVLALTLLLAAGAWHAAKARAQEAPADAWTEPVNLSNTRTDSQYPAIAADASGQVHVLWAENLDGSSPACDALFYTRWDGQSWTPPVDVLISPEGPQAQAGEPAAAVTADGRLHVVWTGGWGGRIYASSAHAGEAASAHAWTKPTELNPGGADGAGPDVALDPVGALHVVYHVLQGAEQGVYHLSSADGGSSWSAPAPIPDSRLGAGTLLADTRLAVGPDGTLHVAWAWAELPDAFPPKGVVYARSTDGGATWSEPLAIADGPFRYPALAAVGRNEVHLVWSGTAEQRSKFHAWSADGGATWSAPQAVLTPGGFQGYADLAVDSGSRLHWVTVGGHPSVSDALLHVQWDGAGWEDAEILATMDELGLAVSQNMGNAALAIRGGNRLHVVVGVPVGTGEQYQGEIYAVSGPIDAPAVPAQPLPQATATAAAEPGPTTPTPTLPAPTAAPSPARGGAGARPAASSLSPLLVGLAAGLLVLGGAAAGIRLRTVRGR